MLRNPGRHLHITDRQVIRNLDRAKDRRGMGEVASIDRRPIDPFTALSRKRKETDLDQVRDRALLLRVGELLGKAGMKLDNQVSEIVAKLQKAGMEPLYNAQTERLSVLLEVGRYCSGRLDVFQTALANYNLSKL